jgi:dienelactone hydrolase
VVLFAHAGENSRWCSQNRLVAGQLGAAGLATLQFDLLAEAEALDLSNRFDVESLARRLIAGIHWVGGQPEVADLPIGLLGGGLGAAAVLVAAAMAPESVAAVVSRGGSPDLAGNDLPRIKAPTLLLVGNLDSRGHAFHAHSLARLTCEKQLVVIPGLNQLSEEWDAQEKAAGWAAEWFVHHLAMDPAWCRSHLTLRESGRPQLAMH